MLGRNETPWQTYKYLTGTSQIPVGERLRSDSASTPDNLWGFPSYAVREALAEKGLRNRLAPLWNVLTEPLLADYYTPRAGQAFSSMAREAERIGWDDMLVRGLVRMVRRREGGGYFSVLTPPPGTSPTPRVAYRSRFVHVAVGYPGLRFLPDLQAYRQRYEDYRRVVNAYEPHEHVYEQLRRQPGTVVVRGAGIVASRILQRLIDDRDAHGTDVKIVHLFRTYVSGTQGSSRFERRRGGNGWAHQGFNWPKAAWGGQLLATLENASDEERRRLFRVWGGTTTPHRRLWLDQLERGRREGWYSELVGEVDSVRPAPDGDQVVTKVRGDDGVLEVPASFVVDATGLEADVREHRLLADLFTHTGAVPNVLGRLHVERDYEVAGARCGDGRLYAVGSPTLGSYYAGVDSFLGLGHAALRISDALADAGFVRRLGPVRSVSQWWKWTFNTKI